MKLRFYIVIFVVIILLPISVLMWGYFSYFKVIAHAAGFEKPVTYLVLLQNNYEIRATGGYIGSFAVVTIDRAKIKKINLFNTNEFDRQSSVKVVPPTPLKEFLQVENWQLRDSNWAPDFPTSARQAIRLHNLQSREQIRFDGVVGVNANILPTLLQSTGPVKIASNEFNKDNAALALEYEVEQGFYQKGISQEERKKVLFQFIKEVINRVEKLDNKEKIQLAKSLRFHLQNKDILLYFDDERLQQAIEGQEWGGIMKGFSGDYLMVVDSNLGAFKSDMFVARNLDYFLDLTDPEKPKARLTVKYKHTAKEENWLVKDYRNFMRVYTPQKTWLEKVGGVNNKTSFEGTKTHSGFGNFMDVELNQQKAVVYQYVLPSDIIKDGTYELLVQKQPGIKKLPVTVTVKSPYKIKRLSPNQDGKLSFSNNKQVVFKKDLESDQVFKIKFDLEK